jgi:hypothetical protein
VSGVVVSLSGGVASWAAAQRTLDRFDPADVTLLFADTLIEDEDLYRFLDEIEEQLDHPIVRISDGRDPWQVFFDGRFIGNTRIDLCSRVLKRELLRKWIDERHEKATVVFGIDWTEEHRIGAIEHNYQPHACWFPLIDEGIGKDQVFVELEATGIARPRLYDKGFQHNNCGGFCVKAGQAQFAALLFHFPERYAHHEQREQDLREHLGKDVAILRDRRIEAMEEYALAHGLDKTPKAIPQTLRTFRERIEAGEIFDQYDWGGCGCALDDSPSHLMNDIIDQPVTLKATTK